MPEKNVFFFVILSIDIMSDKKSHLVLNLNDTILTADIDFL